MPTVLTVDPYPVLRAGVRALLAGSPHQVVGEAGTVSEATALTANLRPDVLLLDVRLGNEDGLSLLEVLRNRSLTTPTLIFSASANPTHAARALALRANGFLSKHSQPEQLIECLSIIAAGGSCWPERSKQRLSGPSAPIPANEELRAPLTRRETQVLEQLALGLNNRDIASALGISYETAKEHVQKILRKMGANDRTQAAVWAVRRGIA